MWLKLTGKSIYFTIICHLKRIFVFNYGKNRSKCWRYFLRKNSRTSFRNWTGIYFIIDNITQKHRQLAPRTPALLQTRHHPIPTPNFSGPFTEGLISDLHNNSQRSHSSKLACISPICTRYIDAAQQQCQQAARNVSAPPHPVVGNRFFSVMILFLWILGIFHQPSRKTIIRAMESRTPT